MRLHARAYAVMNEAGSLRWASTQPPRPCLCSIVTPTVDVIGMYNNIVLFLNLYHVALGYRAGGEVGASHTRASSGTRHGLAGEPNTTSLHLRSTRHPRHRGPHKVTAYSLGMRQRLWELYGPNGTACTPRILVVNYTLRGPVWFRTKFCYSPAGGARRQHTRSARDCVE